VRILYITRTFAPEATPEASRALALVRSWTAAGAHVTVLTSAPRASDTRLMPGYRNHLWHRQILSNFEIIRLWSTPARGASLNLSIYMHKHRLPNATVVLATVPPSAIGTRAGRIAKAMRAPLVLDLIDDATITDSHARQTLIRRAVATSAHCCVTSSAHASDDIPSSRLTVLPPGTDLNVFQNPVYPVEFRRIHGLTGAFVAGYVGPLDATIDLAAIVAAAVQTRNDPSVMWFIAGTGPAAIALRAQKTALGLSNLVIADDPTRADQPVVWSAMDVAVLPLPSNRDTSLPWPALDAMAMRRPIVTASAGPARDLVTSAGCGLPIAPGDPAALADAVRSLAADPERAAEFGAAARTYVAMHHDQDRLARIMLQRFQTAAQADIPTSSATIPT
jgi:colanic acid biosynthesis glycosyl transferase WcaI